MTNNNPPQNYKNSEIGIIPQDWEVKKLGDIGDIATGTTPPTNNRANYGEEYLFVSPADLGKGKYINNTEKKLSQLGFSISRKYPANSILFTCIGSTIGKSGISQIELTSNQQINAIFPNDFYSSDFVFYYLNFISSKIKLGASEQAVPMINKTEFAKTLVAIPTLSEQTAIANALSDADALISSLEKLIEKKRNIKQGAMQKLLQPKEGWEVKKLGEVCDVRDGTHDSPIYYDNGITFITSKNIIKGKIDFNDISHISSEDAYKINQRSKVDKDDILMSMIGTIGNAVLIDFEPDFCIKNIALLKPKSINPVFLIQLIYSSHFQKYIENKLDGGIQKFISLGVLRNLEISVPTPKEQTRIATILSDMDAEIEGLEAKLEKYQAIKLGMMQELLTGKTRLV